MATVINLSTTTPAAPADGVNVNWQADPVPTTPNASRNVSAYMEKQYLVPEGGDPGDVLTRESGDSLVWNPPGTAANGLPAGGTAGQILSKVNGTDFNAEWAPAVGYIADGLSALYDPAPSSPAAEDDEFDGAALDGKWTELFNTTASTSYNSPWKSCVQLNITGDQKYHLQQAMTRAGDFSLACRVLCRPPTSNYQQVFFFLFDDDESDGIRASYDYQSSYGTQMQVASKDAGTWTYNRQRVSSFPSGPLAPSSVYVLVQRVSNAWTVALSMDGLTWSKTASYAKTFTLDHIQFGWSNGGSTAACVVGFDWFRADWKMV